MDSNGASSFGFHGNSGYSGTSGLSNFYNDDNRSKYKGKGKASNNQGQRYYNNQGQKYYNSKLVIHGFAPGILGSPSQFHDGGCSSAIICQLCSQQGYTAANCVYRSTDVPENCQICDRNNHNAKTCFYRNKAKNNPSHMTAMNTTFLGVQHLVMMASQPMYNVPIMMPYSVMPSPMMNMAPSPIHNQMSASTSYAMPSMSTFYINYSSSVSLVNQLWCNQPYDT